MVDLPESYDWNGHAVRWGRYGQGSPVVLCHGTPWSSFVWRRAIEKLANDHTVFVWDMLGYGQSDMPAADVSLAVQSTILTALTRNWGLSSPDIVAHDIGGAVALRSHVLDTVALSSMCLIDVVAIRPWGSPFFRLVGTNSEVFEQLPERLHEALVAEYIQGASGVGLAPEVLDPLIAPWRGAIGQAAFYRQIAQADEAFTDEVEHRYHEIAVPTKIIWGSADAWLPVAHGEKLAGLIAGSSLEVIEGAGHLIMEDAPEALLDAVGEWLDR